MFPLPRTYGPFTHRSEQVAGRERGRKEGDQLRGREETARWRPRKSEGGVVHVRRQHVDCAIFNVKARMLPKRMTKENAFASAVGL